jgi:M6 family metalloprotease-like protein
MDEALAYLSTVMDLSKFDSDSNGIIDAVVLINTLEIGDTDFEWAFRYWNMYTDDYGYYYEYDGVSANDYLWASYQFLYESSNGQSFDDKSAMNTYTYIHEFGHILGADDYYDTAGVNDPMGGHDVMDDMIGDHNAFTKFNLGWLTTSRLVVTDSSVTLTLNDFSKNGDTIIIANSWNEKLGAYQEYYIIAYYTSNGLNNNDIGGGYFARDGIVVYHVNATLTKDEYDGEVYYDILNNNTDSSDDYGTKDNLIEYVLSGNGTYTYDIGDTLPSVKDDNNVTLGYTFTVDALNSEYATITFTKN